MFPISDDNPRRATPIVTWTIIGVCVLVFLWQISLGDDEGQIAVFEFGMIPARLFGEAELGPEFAYVPPWATVFTSMFMHGGFMHLALNMLFLWIFGDNVEDRLGRGLFLVFYLVGGVAAALTQWAIDPASEVPLVGASGAIAAVLGAYLVLFPHARVLSLVLVGFFYQLVAVPAVIVLGFWFLLQLLNGVVSLGMPVAGGGVAFFAHIGGFVAGVVLALPFRGRRRPVRPWSMG